MISHCPHCGRAVSRAEFLVSTRLGWVPTQCAAGDGPLADYRVTEPVLNARYWYVFVQRDDGKRALVTGPFASYDLAQADKWRATRLADVDPRAGFYGWGIASSDAERETVFGLPVPEPAQTSEPVELPPVEDEDPTELARMLGILE